MKLTAVLVTVLALWIAVAFSAQAKEPASPAGKVDPKVFERDKGTIQAWLAERVFFDGVTERRLEYLGEYSGYSTKGKPWRKYVVRFSPSVILGDSRSTKHYETLWFYLSADGKLMAPRPDAPADTPVGMDVELADSIKASIDRDLSKLAPKPKGRGRKR